jgi:hypothetical protein
MKTTLNSGRYHTLEGFLRDLLLVATRRDQVDLLMELLWGIQYDSDELPSEILAVEPDSAFNIFRLSDCGGVWIGVIKGIDRAQKALLCLHENQDGVFFLYDANTNSVVDLPNISTEQTTQFPTPGATQDGYTTLTE